MACSASKQFKIVDVRGVVFGALLVSLACGTAGCSNSDGSGKVEPGDGSSGETGKAGTPGIEGSGAGVPADGAVGDGGTGGVIGQVGAGGAGDTEGEVGTGVAYCSANSPMFGGPDGYSWLLYANRGACVTFSCTPSPSEVCATLMSPQSQEAGIATTFNGPVDLSDYSAIAFTAKVEPSGGLFTASLASSDGKRGLAWDLSAQQGSTTYHVALAQGTRWSQDGAALDLARAEMFVLETRFATGGNLDITVTDVKFIR